MNGIILSNRSIRSNDLPNQCSIYAEDNLDGDNPSTIYPYTPFLVGNNSSSTGLSILNQLKPAPVARELTYLSLSLGGDNLTAISEITAKLQEYNIGLMGASTSVYANRIGGFAGAIKEYQAALMEYRQAVSSKSALSAVAKQKAHAAFQKMQIQFRHELNAVTAKINSRRGTPLTNATRATNIARSSRSAAKLNITSQVQANNLVKFTQHAKYLGNGLAVIDFGSRVGNIHNAYQAGGNWEREMFIESSSFALSAAVGTGAIAVGNTALTLLIAATPVGWVGLIVGGLVVAGVAASASIVTNGAVQKNSGSVYDSIMEWIGSL